MANPGLGWFDPTYYGPTYTEDIEAINRGIELGQKTGQMIGMGILRSRKLQEDIEERNRGALADALAMGKVEKNLQESLVLPPVEGVESLQNARVDFSNSLVNKLNELKQAKENGNITAADYAKGAIVLQQQIPAYKSAEKVLYGITEKYLDALEEGSLSSAISAENKEFFSAMVRGDVDLKFETAENGQVQMVGSFKDIDGKDKPLQMALSRMEELPSVLTRPKSNVDDQIKADVDNIISTKTTNTQAKLNEATGKYEAQVQNIFDKDGNPLDWVKQTAEESFKGYMNSLGEGDKVKGVEQFILDGSSVPDKMAYIEGMTKMLYGEKAESRGLGYKSVHELVSTLKNKNLLDSFINQNIFPTWEAKTIGRVQEANSALVAEQEAKDLSAAAVNAKNRAALKKYNDSAKGSSSEISFTPTQNKLYNLYGAIQDSMSSFNPNMPGGLDAGVDTSPKLDQQKFGKALKQTMGLDFAKQEDEEGNTFFIISSGTKTFNNGKPLKIGANVINDPPVLLQRIGESFKDPDTKQPADYNTILSIYRQRNKFGY
jgi:hypothetical protein